MSLIRQLREQNALSQADLAAAAGTSQPQINRLETGERKMTKKWAERLAKPLNTSAIVLLFGKPETSGVEIRVDNSPAKDLPNAKILGKIEGIGQKIPVYGQAVGGVDGEFEMNGNILYEVMAPPSLSHINGAYGVQISGDSMWPRYEDGEVAFIDPKRRLKKGDYIVAQIQLEENGPLLAYVKKFIRHNAAELVLEQFNPPKELRFEAGTVRTVHFIALAGVA